MTERGHFNHQEPGEPPIQTGRIREVVNFLRVSPVAQFMAFTSLVLAAGLGSTAIKEVSSGDYVASIDSAATSLLYIAFLGLSEALAATNFSEYKRIKQALTRSGWDERIIEPKSHSWCQRNTARVAAINCGYKQEINQYFREHVDYSES